MSRNTEATVLALACLGCLASETWTAVRRPSHHRPYGMRHRSVLADDESASRTRKRVCRASERYCVFGHNPGSYLAPPLSWEMFHRSDYVAAGPMCLHFGNCSVNELVASVLGRGKRPRSLSVRVDCAFAGLALVESLNKVGLSTPSRSRIQPILRIGTLHAVGGT